MANVTAVHHPAEQPEDESFEFPSDRALLQIQLTKTIHVPRRSWFAQLAVRLRGIFAMGRWDSAKQVP
jgi:hypothetical protein